MMKPTSNTEEAPVSQLPRHLFLIPPAIAVMAYGSVLAADATDLGPNIHGIGGAVLALGGVAEACIIVLNAYLVPWSIWRMASHRTRTTSLNVLLVVLGAVSFFAVLLHFNPPLRHFVTSWFVAPASA